MNSLLIIVHLSFQYPLIHFHNIPFTAKSGMWPTYDISSDIEIKPIRVNMLQEQPLHSVCIYFKCFFIWLIYININTRLIIFAFRLYFIS